jgi:FkbM family methyltransferase
MVQRAAARLGLHVTRSSNHIDAQRRRLIERMGVDTVVDVGANVGDYAMELRGGGFDGRIVSFEPLAQPFSVLAARAAGDPQWLAFQFALGSEDADRTMFRSANVVSSSLLPIDADVTGHSPETRTIGEEPVQVKRLDSLRQQVLVPGARAYLKLDVQGFEAEALAGATESLGQVVAVECELSLAAVYSGQPSAWEILRVLGERGYRPVWLERAVTDPRNGWILQMDALFVREHP